MLASLLSFSLRELAESLIFPFLGSETTAELKYDAGE
jgi:hypothetical protein